MEILFGILVGVALSFIFVKWRESQKSLKNEEDTTNQNSGGGVGGGGYVPKDNIK